ncbi:hypothetical protein E0Z10_g3847 [Xylaria hypoxylon]|uniref:Developmental regulatory protein wetA n=1 Tax=Xylaria hypoxylon TaxID=37992 RepID=A0A4Z0YYA4_9PEZI|nr:hypothetical protein E0Z10_g3847 [Xylaria hypoxylon]
MAFTALQFPLDKDQNQLSLWSDNDELAITGDNFFDQFVTFDAGDAATFGGEVFEDPPSPSILLDSLKSELSNPSSQPLGLSHDFFHAEAAAGTIEPIAFAPDTISADQVDPNSAVLAALAEDPILSNGSISDSELLRLEGISLKSSPLRGNVTIPSSPSHATLAPSSPRKHSRFVESIYATIRRAVHPSKPAKQEQYQPIDMASLDAFFDDPRSGLDIFDLNYDEFADPIIPIKQEPVDSHGLPLSPPLTGRIPNEHQHSLTGFVTGHLDDPFCDNLLNTPAIIHSAKHQQINTPMSTPVINSETFLHNQVMTPLNTNMGNFRHPQKAYRSTSSAEWPMEGLLTDVRYSEDVNIWSSAPSSAAYVVDNGNNNMPSPSWWEAAQSEILHAEPSHHHQTTNGGGFHSNGVHNISMQSQQADLPYEYNADLSGLMIHMPQPRAPPASVLSSDLGEQLLATPTLSSSNYHLQSTPTMSRTRTDRLPQHNGNNSKSYGYTDKRPRPRAPSSGARHHGAQTSPRKLHHSMSLGYLREESQSPSPMARQHRHPQHLNGGHHHANHQERQQQRRSSLTVRKQRSFSRRPGGEPRTPSTSTSATFAATPTPGSGGGGIGGAMGFVNFTPSDKNQLMSGVAPSGSSKTKARREKEAHDREKEAQEKARQISEIAYKAVREVGGDVTKLIGDFGM